MTNVLVDSSVWVAHFRASSKVLQSLLSADRVLCHPLIILELACGTPPDPRTRTLGNLRRLRQATVSSVEETLALIEREHLQKNFCGAVDISLLASTLLTPEAALWTEDKNLKSLAAKMGVAFQ